jgi:hypothetical protein
LPNIPQSIELPGNIFIALLNIADPLIPALSAESISIEDKLVFVKSPIASTAPEAAEIAAPQGPIFPIVLLRPSLRARSPWGMSDPDIPPRKDPIPLNEFVIACFLLFCFCNVCNPFKKEPADKEVFVLELAVVTLDITYIH